MVTAIPPVRHTDGQPGGFDRSQMSDRWLKRMGYGLRWHMESFMSGSRKDRPLGDASSGSGA